MGKGVMGGIIAGLMGAAIWGGITYATHREIGWIAWGIGFLVGLGVRIGSQATETPTLGLAAALIAVASVVVGKFLAVYFIVAGLPTLDVKISPQDMIVGYALDVCDERAAKGKPVRFAQGMDSKKANKQADFPKDVWSEATKRWDKLGPQGQQDEIKKQQQLIVQIGDAFKGELRSKGFADSFSPWDLLWGFLAVSTAFKIATGMVGNE